MKIGFVGDTHGNWLDLYRAMDLLSSVGVERIVQVGDFGFWKQNLRSLKLEIPVYFIDGNHEEFPLLLDRVSSNRLTPQEVLGNLFYIPRGTVLNWGDTIFGFLGGGFSVDYKLRKDGVSWFSKEETPKEEEARKLINHQAEFIVTHDAPSEAVAYMPKPLRHTDTRDTQCRMILQGILNEAKPAHWVHGHYHMRYSTRIQDCKIVGLDCAPDIVVFDTNEKRFLY